MFCTSQDLRSHAPPVPLASIIFIITTPALQLACGQLIITKYLTTQWILENSRLAKSPTFRKEIVSFPQFIQNFHCILYDRIR